MLEYIDSAFGQEYCFEVEMHVFLQAKNAPER